MGKESEVEIEPAIQTELADRTDELNGVIASLVPGAGGTDAIFSIVVSSAARKRVEALWGSWHETHGAHVSPLLLSAEKGFQTGTRLEPTIQWD